RSRCGIWTDQRVRQNHPQVDPVARSQLTVSSQLGLRVPGGTGTETLNRDERRISLGRRIERCPDWAPQRVVEEGAGIGIDDSEREQGIAHLPRIPGC